jgi:hypothetical protein
MKIVDLVTQTFRYESSIVFDYIQANAVQKETRI